MTPTNGDSSNSGDSPPQQQKEHVAPMRVLCLHDANSNAMKLYDCLQELDNRLYQRHAIEFVYVNSPLCCNNDENTDGNALQLPEEHKSPLRMWWESLAEDRITGNSTSDTSNNGADEEGTTRSEKRLGLDASFQHICQVWNTMPFHGVLAVGQGAAVASLLPFVVSGNLDFSIFVHGHALLEEDERLIGDDETEWNCLHVMDADDSQSQILLRQLGGEVHLSSGEQVTRQDFNAIGKFLVQQKKKSRCDQTKRKILAVRSKLHKVEQQAARLVAQHIAENPPKALMAVITPSSVGGWSGPKRRQPQEEGGGAPCPADFLLKKEQRDA